eukprot:Awhi_evm1s3606
MLVQHYILIPQYMYYCDKKGSLLIHNETIPWEEFPELPFLGVAAKCDSGSEFFRVTSIDVKLKQFDYDFEFHSMSHSDVVAQIYYSNNPHFEDVAKQANKMHSATENNKDWQDAVSKLITPYRGRRGTRRGKESKNFAKEVKEEIDDVIEYVEKVEKV